jgi:hypothetical protein
MQSLRNSVYKGSAVSVRSTESHDAILPSRFTAGYRITLADGEECDWCYFTDLAFDTRDHAASFALTRAQLFLDDRCLGLDLQSSDQVAGTYRPRLDSTLLTAIQGASDPHPGKAALTRATPECIDKFSLANMTWISSADVRIDIVNGRPRSN